MLSHRLGHLQWNQASLTLHIWGHQGTACQKSSRLWHKHTRNTPFTSKAQHIGRFRYSSSIHQLPHLLLSTLFTLYTSGHRPQQLPHHIQPSLICHFGLLQTHHINLLWRKALLVRRTLHLNRLASIWQGIQMAPHSTPDSIIQPPKWTLANLFGPSPEEASPGIHLSRVLSLSWDTQPYHVLSPGPIHLAPTVVHSCNTTQVHTYDPNPHLWRPQVWHHENPDLQLSFSLISDNKPINQAIFLVYTKQSSTGWSHTMQTSLPTLGSAHAFIHAVQSSIQHL